MVFATIHMVLSILHCTTAPPPPDVPAPGCSSVLHCTMLNGGLRDGADLALELFPDAPIVHSSVLDLLGGRTLYTLTHGGEENLKEETICHQSLRGVGAMVLKKVGWR